MDLDEDAILVPPDCAYRCHEDAYSALKRHGTENGYGFRLKRT
jgi:hypothetical protein